MGLFDETATAMGTGMNAISAVNPVVAGIGAIPEVFKLGLGVSQALRARKIEKSQQRPLFTIPGAAQDAMAGQYNLATGQAPGLNTAMQQLSQAQAGSTAAVQNSGGGGERLAALTMLDQNAGNQALQLGAQQQQWQAAQQQNLINQQNQYADWQQRAWEFNKYKPYEQAMDKAAELRNAANTNIYGAAKAGGGLISSALSGGTDTVGATAQKAASGLVGGATSGGVMGKTISQLAKEMTPEIEQQTPSLMPDISQRGMRQVNGLGTYDVNSTDKDKLFRSQIGIADPLQPRYGSDKLTPISGANAWTSPDFEAAMARGRRGKPLGIGALGNALSNIY